MMLRHQAEWWLLSKEFIDGHIREPPWIPPPINQHSHDDVPEYIYQHMVEQDKLLKEQRKKIQAHDLMINQMNEVLQADKSRNKTRNANILAFNLGKEVVDNNVRDDEVMITGARATKDYVSFENVDPNKVMTGLQLYTKWFQDARTVLGDGVAIPSDAVITDKRRHQNATATKKP
nr:hypothetical protein [Tanacetum cinerariifolium]